MGTWSSTGLRLPVTGLPQLLGWARGLGWDEKLSLELKPSEGKEAQNSEVQRPTPSTVGTSLINKGYRRRKSDCQASLALAVGS